MKTPINIEELRDVAIFLSKNDCNNAKLLIEWSKKVRNNPDGFNQIDKLFAETFSDSEIDFDSEGVIRFLIPLIEIFNDSATDEEAIQSLSDTLIGIIKITETGEINPDDVNKLINWIINIDNELLSIIKVRQMLSFGPNAIIEARVITDLRPIFSPLDRKSKPYEIIAISNIHFLKLKYFADNGLKEQTITLSDNNLEQLKREIDRALAKREAIKNSCGKECKFYVSL